MRNVTSISRLYLAPVLDDTTLLRGANLIQPATLHRLLDRVTALARALQVTRGRKLRLDGTVVETDVHHPSESTLLADSVWVLSRLVHRAQVAVEVGTSVARGFRRNRTRAANLWTWPPGPCRLRSGQRPWARPWP